MSKEIITEQERLVNIDAMIRQYLAAATDLMINIRILLKLRKVLIGNSKS